MISSSVTRMFCKGRICKTTNIKDILCKFPSILKLLEVTLSIISWLFLFYFLPFVSFNGGIPT